MSRYKKSTLFLVKFFTVYFLLFLLYSFYLNKNQQREAVFSCAPLTKSVANQTVRILQFVGFDAQAVQHTKELSVKILINQKYTARVIEGCNSVSIIILFIAFIIAFSGKPLATVLFSIAGSLVIYTINLLRIAFLTAMLYKFPNQEVLLHNLIFPAIIYGTTFLLWVLWVHKFSNYKK